jgi:D-3-phosphoglycerate dehydrogenase
MVNSSKGELAYTVVDLDAPVPDAVFKQISSIKGVVMARLIQEPK